MERSNPDIYYFRIRTYILTVTKTVRLKKSRTQSRMNIGSSQNAEKVQGRAMIADDIEVCCLCFDRCVSNACIQRLLPQASDACIQRLFTHLTIRGFLPKKHPIFKHALRCCAVKRMKRSRFPPRLGACALMILFDGERVNLSNRPDELSELHVSSNHGTAAYLEVVNFGGGGPSRALGVRSPLPFRGVQNLIDDTLHVRKREDDDKEERTQQRDATEKDYQ